MSSAQEICSIEIPLRDVITNAFMLGGGGVGESAEEAPDDAEEEPG